MSLGEQIKKKGINTTINIALDIENTLNMLVEVDIKKVLVCDLL